MEMVVVFGRWDTAPAKVVDRQNITHNAQSTYSIYKYVVELQSPEGETFRAEMRDPHGGRPSKVRAPGIGEQITVKVHWGDREVTFNSDDPVLAYDPVAGAKAQKAKFAASLAGDSPARSGGPRIVVSPGANVTIGGKRIGGPPNVADELQRIVAMHEQGLLNDAQFEAAKSKMLGS
jgi:hypothetical protein